ncbi:MAG TPA: hypothetical protein VK427_01795 [Kofleriaceae bacterium]|nr:hypothetical protein [Kofleriaceae bacterium]
MTTLPAPITARSPTVTPAQWTEGDATDVDAGQSKSKNTRSVCEVCHGAAEIVGEAA